MNRKEKIDLIKSISEGKEGLKSLIIKNEHPLPSWYWGQFETHEELLSDLKKNRGEKVKLIWHDGKPYCIDKNPKQKKPNWFGK